jgi:hypothetical protein
MHAALVRHEKYTVMNVIWSKEKLERAKMIGNWHDPYSDGELHYLNSGRARPSSMEYGSTISISS